jgi:hypothetical protein
VAQGGDGGRDAEMRGVMAGRCRTVPAVHTSGLHCLPLHCCRAILPATMPRWSKEASTAMATCSTQQATLMITTTTTSIPTTRAVSTPSLIPTPALLTMTRTRRGTMGTVTPTSARRQPMSPIALLTISLRSPTAMRTVLMTMPVGIARWRWLQRLLKKARRLRPAMGMMPTVTARRLLPRRSPLASQVRGCPVTYSHIFSTAATPRVNPRHCLHGPARVHTHNDSTHVFFFERRCTRQGLGMFYFLSRAWCQRLPPSPLCP